MIDIHCHLLPGIDDGAATLDEALQLARLAVADGITECVATPHIQPGRYDNDVHTIRESWVRFGRELDCRRIPLKLHMAAEVRLCAELLGLVAEGRLPFLGRRDGKEVLLVELPHGHIPPGTAKFMAWLLDRQIQPLIAHPERNKDVMRDRDKLAPLMELGCLLQLTAASVTGGFGPAARTTADHLLRQGWVFAVATDAHDTVHRPPKMEQAFRLLADMGGEDFARRLCRENPAALLAER